MNSFSFTHWIMFIYIPAEPTKHVFTTDKLNSKAQNTQPICNGNQRKRITSGTSSHPKSAKGSNSRMRVIVHIYIYICTIYI